MLSQNLKPKPEKSIFGALSNGRSMYLSRFVNSIVHVWSWAMIEEWGHSESKQHVSILATEQIVLKDSVPESVFEAEA